jgi:hypothetical protein
MPYTITLGFATEHERDAFVEKIVPKVRAHLVEPLAAEEGAEDKLHRIGLAVTSPTAAKDVCNHIIAFLAHSKNTRVDVYWTGLGGEVLAGEVNAGAPREAEILALRIAAAAKAELSKEA